MKKTLSFLRFFVLLLSMSSYAISPMNFKEETQRLEKINVSEELRENIRHGDFRFVSVQGFTEIVPGVDDYRVKYSSYGTRKIAGTGDAILNEDHRKFNQVAADYAKRYNLLLLKKIQKK